jgi:beta-lactamase superfamily II metal-dependent hydrolase
MSIVKSLSVGNGDMFYIKHNSDNFTIIDCCMSEDNKERIVKELKEKSTGNEIVTRFISTHPDDDHICGLGYLHQHMNLLNFYCVENEATKPDETDDFDQYCALRDDLKKVFHIYQGCSRKWMNLSDDTRKTAGIDILWPDTENQLYQQALQDAKDGISWNNMCPIVKYGVQGGATILWMGDLESGFMEEIKDSLELPEVDILFAPHHGRDSGEVPPEWLEQMAPSLIVIGEALSEHLNYYYPYNTITQNSAGDITFDCVAGKVHIYVSNWKYSVDFLEEDGQGYSYGNYIGTLSTKAGNAAAAAGSSF